jgi:uncharacterized protein
MPMPPLPDLSTMSLADVAKALAEQRLPPVDQWNPTHCGDSEMRIARDGTWYHQGSPIGREAMVRLFSTILRREADGSYVLVTPGEKLDIVVDDVPFIAVEVKNDGTGPARTLTFRLNTGDLIVAGPDHALRFSETPYIHVRGGMEARVARPVYYELANLALDEANHPTGLWSDDVFFPLAAA